MKTHTDPSHRLGYHVVHSGARCETPLTIIFDTDAGGDSDDIGALFLLHGAVERGEAKLLATMGCT